MNPRKPRPAIAWCPHCEEECLPHVASGRCMFCDSQTVPFDQAPEWAQERREERKRELRERMAEAMAA